MECCRQLHLSSDERRQRRVLGQELLTPGRSQSADFEVASHEEGRVRRSFLPEQKENYIHRIGRSGRHGRKGVAINLITKEDTVAIRELESFYNTQIDEMPMNIADYI